GIAIVTGSFFGSFFSIPRSGNTTSVAQVSSVVRVKTSDAGAPFLNVTLFGLKPSESAVTATVPVDVPPGFEQAVSKRRDSARATFIGFVSNRRATVDKT